MQHTELRITLLGIDPEIWRRVRVSGDLSLAALHLVVQKSMQWKNYHLWWFTRDGDRWTIPDPELNFDPPPLDARTVQVDDVLTPEMPVIGYEYDFGDEWKLTLELVSTNADAPNDSTVTLLDGELAAPPEDCGGVHGYNKIVDGLESGDLPPRYDNWIGDWRPDDFDPADIQLPGRDELDDRVQAYANRSGAPAPEDYDPFTEDDLPDSLANPPDGFIEQTIDVIIEESPEDDSPDLDPDMHRRFIRGRAESSPVHFAKSIMARATRLPEGHPFDTYPQSNDLADCLARIPVEHLDAIVANSDIDDPASTRDARERQLVDWLTDSDNVELMVDRAVTDATRPLFSYLAERQAPSNASSLIKRGLIDLTLTDNFRDWMRVTSDHPVARLLRHGLVHLGIRNRQHDTHLLIGMPTRRHTIAANTL